MSKTINFKPGLKPATVEDWVQGARPAEREAPTLLVAARAPAPAASEAMKRFTIVPGTWRAIQAAPWNSHDEGFALRPRKDNRTFSDLDRSFRVVW